MFGNVSKTNGMKLVAMVMIMAMVVAGAAVVFSDNGVSATTQNQDFIQKEGDTTISDNIEIDVTQTFDSSNYAKGVSFVKDTEATADRYTVTLTMEATANGTLMFNGVDITVGDGITLILNMTTASTVTTPFVGNHIIQNGDLTISGSGIVEFKQSANAQGITYCSLDTTSGNDLTLSDSAKLIFNGANGVSEINVTTTGTSSIEFNGASSGKVALGFAVTDIGAGTSVIMKDSKGFFYMDGNTTINGTLDAGASEIKFPDKTAEVTIGTTGSVTASQITGDVTADNFTNNGELNAKMQLTNDAGKVTYLNGPVSSNDVKLAEDAILENVTVNPGVTLKINGAATVKGDMRVYGTIAPATAPTDNKATATLTVGQDATLTAYAGASVAKGLDVVSTGNGKIDLSAAMSTVTLNDDIESDFEATQSQKVVIADTLTIKTGYKMTILGELVINEGCTVIIEDGAKLIVGSTVNKIKATGVTVNGNIEVENGGTIEVQNAEDVTVVGTITSSGTVTINSNVTVKNGGSIVIEDYENDKGEQTSNIDVDKGLTVEAGGELSIAGNMYIGTISNKGTVTLDGAIIAERSTIQMTAAGAVVDIKSMTQKVIGGTVCSLIVEDAGLYLYTDKATETDVPVSADDKNIIAFDGAVKASGDNAVDVTDGIGIRNITITSVLETEKVDKDTTNYYNQFVISGSPSIYDDTVNGDFNGTYAINMNAYDKSTGASNVISSIEVPESLTIGRNVNVTLGNASFGGVMNVDGTVTATAEGALITSHGEIYVNGMITTDINAEIKDGINAFHYTDDDYNYYTTLKTSVDNGATDIEYIGSVTVLDSVTIPAGTEVTKATNGVRMTIGDGDHRDVVVTFTDGATMRSSVVNVMGTLVFDNNKTGNRNNNITSDVIIDEEPKRTYTNIYTALSNAADGSTITIAPTTNVYLDKDAEIRETITLEVPAGSGLYLYNDVTLTVNGTLKNSGSVDNAYPDPDSPVNAPSADRSQCDGFQPVTSADDDRQPAAIVANGTVMSMTEMEYGYYYIAGAYYQMIDDQGSWYYITPVEQAAAVSNDVENGKIEIFGENTVGDITFTGDEKQAVEVTVTGTLNAGTITLDRAGIIVNGAFTGTAASAAGSVDVVNATGFSVVDTYVDETEVTYLDGTPVAADNEKDSSVTVATGTVNAGQISIVTDDAETAYIGSFSIAEGATLDVSGQYNRANASVDASKMTVDGTMNVANNGKVTITDALTVRGTFTVASADDNGNSAGIADIKKMYVGIAENKDKKFVDASAATVTSDETIASLATIYVSGESTITGDLTSNMQSTEFYVEDALWMTVYATSAAADKLEFVTVGIDSNHNPTYAYSFQPGDLDNSEFVYWADANGEQIIDGNAKVGDSDYQQVYANLNYDIYTITVFADPGIQAVYVDGKLMTSGTFQTGVDGMWAQGFRLSVAAGEHEITYKLGNYYSGEAKMTVNGTAVEGNTFTTSGTTTADKNVTIYLQGVQASGPETPSTTGGDDGMGLTDYLLIILVVLIVIMAIIVALRLMRS